MSAPNLAQDGAGRKPSLHLPCLDHNHVAVAQREDVSSAGLIPADPCTVLDLRPAVGGQVGYGKFAIVKVEAHGRILRFR